MASLGKLTNLQSLELDLWNTYGADCHSLSSLSSLQKLQMLKLDVPSIDDGGATALASLSRLTRLALRAGGWEQWGCPSLLTQLAALSN